MMWTNPKKRDAGKGEEKGTWGYKPANATYSPQTWTSIGVAIKTFETEFWKRYRKGPFCSPKTQKFVTNVLRL